MTISTSSSIWFDGATSDRARFGRLGRNVETDVIIVGGGIVGILSAWHLSSQGRRVVLLEKNHLATGDSGATTGFVTRIPDTSLAELIKKQGIGRAQRITALYQTAQNELFQLIAGQDLDCDFVPCETLEGGYAPNDPTIAREWPAIERLIADAVRVNQPNPEIAPFQDAIQIPCEGSIHLRKFLLELIKHFPAQSVSIYEESEVMDVEMNDTRVRAITQTGTVTGDALILASGSPPDCFPELQPLLQWNLTFVLAAYALNMPIRADLFVDTSNPYFYFRRANDHTIVLGGCDAPANRKSPNPSPHDPLHRFLQQHLPEPWRITHQWSGSIFHTTDHLPYAFEHPYSHGRVFVGMGLSGNGIVGGALVAKLLADQILGHVNPMTELFALQRTGVTLKTPSRPVHSTPQPPTWTPVAQIETMKSNQPICATVGEQKLLLCRLEDNVYAVANTCSHAGGSLCDGMLEGCIIQCPLHGARFDVTNGSIQGPPATRPQQTFPVRVRAGIVEVQLSATPPAAKKTIPKISHWRSLLQFLPIPLGVGAIEVLTQRQWFTQEDFGLALIRGFGFSGATFIAAALFSSAIFKWRPQWAVHWRLRRYLGVSGLLFIGFHVVSAYQFFFQWDLQRSFFSFNPIVNPVVFGSLAFLIFFLLAATSTDWAVRVLTPKRWKMLHRFVYVGEWAAVFHFLRMNPSILTTPPAIILLALTAAALGGELFWLVKIAAKQKFRSFGTLVGLGILLLYLLTATFILLS
ncbi:MAG: FAD-dependent oxidoreductase [Patescibacteria group bacterium]